MIRSTRIFIFLGLACLLFTLHLFYSEYHRPSSSDHGHHDVEPIEYITNRGGPAAAAAVRAAAENEPASLFDNLELEQEQEHFAAGREQPQHPLKSPNQDFHYAGVPVDEKGLMSFDPAVHEKHPVELLIERGRAQAKAIEDRIAAVNTLEAAVADYERAWGMKPPRGFEHWFRFAQDKASVAAPSMFPLAHRPFEQFLALSPQEINERIAQGAAKKGPFWTFTFVPDGQGDEGTQTDEDGTWQPNDWHTRGRGRVKVGGNFAWKWRCNNTLTLILPILAKFPEEFFTQDPPVMLLFNNEDGPAGRIHQKVQERGETLGKAGKTWPSAQLKASEQAMRWTSGWQWTCPEGSPLRVSAADKVLNDEGVSAAQSGQKAFVADFYKSTDICYNPEIRELHASAIADYRMPAGPLMPQISVCRTLRNSDIVGMPLDAVYQNPPLIPWAEKANPKVLWRGSPTGIFHNKAMPWRQAQRERLHYLANNHSEATAPVLVQGLDGLQVREFPLRDMNEQWFDIGLFGGPAQCSEEDGSCAEMEAEFEWRPSVRGNQALEYKYVVDVDGNGWSSRFRRLLKSNHVVLKSTLFPEWFNDLLIPWYHYVPIRFDYADLYDVMAYFKGAPDGSTRGRDDVAEQIAQNALNFVDTHWRVEDMESFMFLVMLEYWRLISEDRQKMTYGA